MNGNKFLELRQKAEEVIKQKGLNKSADYFYDVEKLIEELNIFQIELEMQNTELQLTNEKLTTEQKKYRNLYQDAPIAYFTLNETGNIYDINHAAAQMLNLPIQAFNKTSIFPYLTQSSKSLFNQFFKKVFNSENVEYTRIDFVDTNQQVVHAKLNAQWYFDDALKINLCRCAVTDITLEKEYEKQLTEKNELLNLAFDNERVAWWDWDYASRQVRFSPNKATMLGYSVEEFPTDVYEITALIHPDDFAETMEVMRNHLQGKTPFYEVTYRIKTKTGAYVYYYDYGKVIERTHEGNPKRLNGIVFNINQQKQFEVALQQARIKAENSENYNKMLFEILPVGLALHKPNGEHVYVNKAYTEIIGYTAHETLQLTNTSLTPPKYARQEQEQLKSLETTGFYGPYEKEYLHKSGNLIPVRLQGRYVSIDNETYIWSSVENYSEKKKYEQTILAKEQRFRAIFEQSAAGIGIVDKSQRFVEVNNKFCELLGYSKEELLTLTVKDITYIEDAEKNFDLVKNNFKQGNNSFFNIEKRYVCKNGTVFWANLSTNVIKDENGKMDFGIATIVDINNRKNTELELIAAKEKAEESDMKFKAAFYTSPDSVNINKLNGEYVDINEGFTRLTGYTKNDVIGKLSSEIEIWAIPEDRVKLLNDLAQFGLVENLESIFRQKDGTLTPALMSAKIIKINNQPHILSVTREIANRKKMELELLNAKEKAEKSKSIIHEIKQNYETFFDTIDEFLFVLDAAGNIIHFNQTVENRLGYSKEELLEKPVLLVHPEARRNEAAQIVSDMLMGKAEFCPVPLETKQGVSIPVETRVKKGIWYGKPVLFGVSKDVTKLKLSEEKFSKVFFLNPSACGLTQVNSGKYVEINDAFCKLLGFTKQETIGHTATELQILTSQTRDTILSKIDNFGSLYNAETELRTKNGEIKKVLLSAENIYLQDVAYRYTVVHDITDLQTAKEKAKESDRLKSAFLQNMSHEVRTPLNAISGFSQLLAKENQPIEKIRKFSEIITQSSDKLIEIISDVIEISEIHADLIYIKSSVFDFIQIVKDTIHEFKLKLEDKDVEFIVNSNIKSSEFFILSDKMKISKMLRHLIDNALKFTEKGQVILDINMQLDRLEFTVIDSGIGISKEMQQKIFEPFRQIELGMSRNYGGNGLGLAIVKAYTETLKGTIQLQSEPNVGTSVCISIPASQILEKKELKMIQKQAYLFNTILIVEDELINYEYLTELFSETKMTILHAVNGKQAVDICKDKQNIDFVLMDLKMPVMDGYAATKLIKAFRPELPIIAQTAYTSTSDKERFLENGFDDYIVKPIHEKILFEILDKYLNR